MPDTTKFLIDNKSFIPTPELRCMTLRSGSSFILQPELRCITYNPATMTTFSNSLYLSKVKTTMDPDTARWKSRMEKECRDLTIRMSIGAAIALVIFTAMATIA